MKQLADSGHPGCTAWLRISDDRREGHWYDTMNNSRWYGYTNWSNGEPNNSNGLEHYAVIDASSKSWNDVQGSDKFYVVCEF